MPMPNNEWLGALSPGDKVIEVCREIGDSRRRYVRTVSAVTRTQIQIKHEATGYVSRFRKDDGYSTSGNWDSSYLEQAVPATVRLVREENTRKALVHRIYKNILKENATENPRLSLEDLRAFCDKLCGEL